MAEEIVTTDVTTGGANGDGTEVRDTGATPRDEGSGQEKTYTQADFEKALQSETDKRVRQATETLKAEWQKQLKTEKSTEFFRYFFYGNFFYKISFIGKN